VPVFDVHTMLQALYTINGFLSFQLGAALAGILGALGLILALVAVFGVISFSSASAPTKSASAWPWAPRKRLSCA
jgi:hypothetical protein